MSIKIKVVRAIIKWLWLRWPYLLRDTVIPPNAHVHLNPGQRKKVTP
jgi:hypothetical protein